MAAFVLQPEPPPLRREADGALRVGASRVLFELVMHLYRSGATPEEIVECYDSLDLSDVYACIAYALRHPEETQEYLNERERCGEEFVERLNREQAPFLNEIRARIEARRSARETGE
jgi:uncharacterized protein (DUF433 family)